MQVHWAYSIRFEKQHLIWRTERNIFQMLFISFSPAEIFSIRRIFTRLWNGNTLVFNRRMDRFVRVSDWESSLRTVSSIEVLVFTVTQCEEWLVRICLAVGIGRRKMWMEFRRKHLSFPIRLGEGKCRFSRLIHLNGFLSYRRVW